jgi:chromosomal replication initiator protein
MFSIFRDQHLDGLFVTSGVFTLPLFGIDSSNGSDSCRSGEVNWGFITGPENALLRVLIDAATSDQPRYNPITLCGPTGVGKSHLLLGVLNQVRSRLPERKCWYLTGADFARQYARSVELDSLLELREKLATTRFLMIDGLDELSSKPAAQHELLQIIDQSLDRQTQVLLAGQSAHSQWSWMPASLRSRLEGGLIVPVVPPGAATRAEIVRQIQIELGLAESNTLNLLARRTDRRQTFRELKHELVQLAADQQKKATAMSGSRPESTGQSSQNASIRRISKQVARSFEIKFSELISSSRRKTVAQARGVAIYLSRSLLGVSFEQLGKNFGNRDHTTILHAYRKTADLLESDLVLKQMIERIREDLATGI